MSNSSQSPNFHLSKTPTKFSNNKQVLIKNNKPTKSSGKSRYYNKNNNNNNMLNNENTSFNNNKKPMKVVHISNPIRFQATPAEFRALVQGLTGRDAVVADDNHCFGTHQADAVHDDDHGGGANSSSNDNTSDDDKVLLMQHHNTNDNNNHIQDDYDYAYHQQQQQQEEVNMSACFGPSSDQLSFDYYGAFSHGADFVAMEEDLRAFMDDYGH